MCNHRPGRTQVEMRWEKTSPFCCREVPPGDWADGRGEGGEACRDFRLPAFILFSSAQIYVQKDEETSNLKTSALQWERRGWVAVERREVRDGQDACRNFV